MTAAISNEYEFDVALSFAGEDREYVEEVNAALKAEGVRTLLDSDYEAESWGEDLVEYFDAVYRLRSRYAILFISKQYAKKIWPRHERRSALARALEERSAYVLPVRLDDTMVDGLRPTVKYLDTRRTGIDGLVRALLAKLHGRSGWPDGWPGDRAPRTQRELEQVRSSQPLEWEYLFFAGVLYLGKETLEGSYRDHELGWAELNGKRVEDLEARSFLMQATDDARALLGAIDVLFSTGAQQRAFGEPGVLGDPGRIRHLAERWNSVYAGLLDWSAKIRGTSHSGRFDDAFELLAKFADMPIQQYREFVDNLVEQYDRIPHALATNEPLVITSTLTLSVDEEISAALSAELQRIASTWDE